MAAQEKEMTYQEALAALEGYIADPDAIAMHETELANLLLIVKQQDSEQFGTLIARIPEDILGDVLLELPETDKDTAIEQLSVEKLADVIHELDSDDAVDLMQDIEEVDEEKRDSILSNLQDEDLEEIQHLSRYEEDEAGAFMQLEMFKAHLDESVGEAIERLKRMKREQEIQNVHQLFVVDNLQKLIATIPLEDIILFEFHEPLATILAQHEEAYRPRSIFSTDDIKDVVRRMEQYNLAVIAVTDRAGRLLGRITSDDVYDLIEEHATEQLYNLAGVNDEAEDEQDIKEVTKTRAWWLLINMGTAILASLVIGMFDDTIQQYVALAVLMPIVASMGGNAGTQTLTVMVRQLALGEVSFSNAKAALLKEVKVSLMNGMLFACVAGVIAYIWFRDQWLGVVIGLAMIVNLLAAGFFGAMIPLLLRRLDIDPAVGSSVLLTTVTDVVGFFAFLFLAKVILIS